MYRDDWTLVLEQTGQELARIYDTQQPDILGSWRWHVTPFYLTANQGSALSGAEAKRICEERLTKTKAASARADGFGYTRSLDKNELSLVLLERICAST